MSYQAIVFIINGLLFGAFIFSNAKQRFAIIILGLFLYGLSTDIGITIDPPKSIAIAGWLAIVLDTGKIKSLHKKHWLAFLFWAITITLIASFATPYHANDSWARSSDYKWIVQLFSKFIYVSYVFHIVPYVSAPQNRFNAYRLVLTVAVISAILCLFQVGYQQITGRALWGVFRGPDHYDVAVVNFGNRIIQRANGFAGEPKQQAMALGIGLVILIARPTIIRTFTFRWLAILLLISASVLTFSSGYLLVMPLFLLVTATYAIVRRVPKTQFVVLGIVALIGTTCIMYPTRALDFYETRVLRTQEKIELLRNPEGLDDKEVPALRSLLSNPNRMITGVGVGSSPFYFENMLETRFRGDFEEPNSGITNIIYSVGIIGMVLLLVAIWVEVKRACEDRVMTFIWIYMLLYLLPLTSLAWIVIAVGLTGSGPLNQKGRIA